MIYATSLDINYHLYSIVDIVDGQRLSRIDHFRHHPHLNIRSTNHNASVDGMYLR